LCPVCKHEWESSVNNRNKNGKINSGCPVCKEFKGETEIRRVLLNKKVSFDSQYFFNDLVGINGGYLLFDFAVFYDEEQTKLKMLIEYDGLQHDKWIKSFQTKKQYLTMKEHDKRKDEYCKERGIKLIRIKEHQFDKIEEIIFSIIK